MLSASASSSQTGLQAGETRLRIGKRFQDYPVQVGMALVPVVRVFLEHEPVAGAPRFQNERSGTDGIAVVILAFGLPRGRRLHGVVRVWHAQCRRKVHGGIVQIVDKRQLIGRLHVADSSDIESAAAFIGRIFLAVEIGLRRFGVERRTVVKLDAGPQLEGPGLEIVRMGPGQRELGLGYGLVVEISERIEKRRGRRECGGIEDADLQWIETGDVQLKADGDAAAGFLSLRGACKRANAKHRSQENSRKRVRYRRHGTPSRMQSSGVPDRSCVDQIGWNQLGKAKRKMGMKSRKRCTSINVR